MLLRQSLVQDRQCLRGDNGIRYPSASSSTTSSPRDARVRTNRTASSSVAKS